MRFIGSFDQDYKASAFSQFLFKHAIPHVIETKINNDWGSIDYGSNEFQIWIQEEDDFQKSFEWYNQFIANPKDPFFSSVSSSSWDNSNVSPSENLENSNDETERKSTSFWEKQPLGPITKTLIALCCLLFFLSQLLTPNIDAPNHYSGLSLFTSPIDKALAYDYPKYYELINQLLLTYGYQNLKNPENLSEEGKALIKETTQTPFWPGLYHIALKEGFTKWKNAFCQYPTFEKIREGEVWRLFTPSLLHADIFHILFNMLWLIVLGKQIEQRLSKGRYIFFILLIGILSNTAQYIMTGPNFIGFSGILCGMLAFIWVRQKRAAWEGYQMDRMTLIFMLIYILGMAAIQFVSFFVEKSFDWGISPNIANMAHLSGGFVGYVLGKTNFFAWRHS